MPPPNTVPPLLALPPELRNRIWANALICFSPQTLFDKPALLATCKEVRYEARAMYWRNNKFYLEVLELPDNPHDWELFQHLHGQLRRLGWLACANICDLTIVVKSLSFNSAVMDPQSWAFIGWDPRTWSLKPESISISSMELMNSGARYDMLTLTARKGMTLGKLFAEEAKIMWMVRVVLLSIFTQDVASRQALGEAAAEVWQFIKLVPMVLSMAAEVYDTFTNPEGDGYWE